MDDFVTFVIVLLYFLAFTGPGVYVLAVGCVAVVACSRTTFHFENYNAIIALGCNARLGLMHPSKVGFKLLAGTFLVCHTIKLAHLDVVHGAHSPGKFADVHELTLRLGSIHLEAGLVE